MTRPRAGEILLAIPFVIVGCGIVVLTMAFVVLLLAIGLAFL